MLGVDTARNNVNENIHKTMLVVPIDWRFKLLPVRQFGKHEERDHFCFWEVHRVIWQLSDQDYADYEHLYLEGKA